MRVKAPLQLKRGGVGHALFAAFRNADLRVVDPHAMVPAGLHDLVETGRAVPGDFLQRCGANRWAALPFLETTSAAVGEPATARLIDSLTAW